MTVKDKAKTPAMNKLIPITKFPSVFPKDIEVVKDKPNTYKLKATAKLMLAPEDKEKNLLALAAIKAFKELEFEATSLDEATDKISDALISQFTITKKKPVDASKADPKPETKKADPEVKQETKEADKPKESATKEESKKAPKTITTFEFMTESYSVTCTQMSPENKEIVADALKYFEVLSKFAYDNDPALTPAEKKVIAVPANPNDKTPYKAVAQLMNRNTVRLLIDERDAKNKLVAQLLLKVLYVCPLHILCVVEAHNAPQPNKSAYKNFVTLDYEKTSYDAMLFHPHHADTKYTTQALAPATTNVSFQFVNVLASERQPKPE